MIPRHRLRGRGRFAAVRSTGTRASVAALRIQVAPNDLDVARVGFALPGLRSSVRRNQLRRRLREAIRPELPRLAANDVVVVAGAGAAELPYSELRAAIVAAVSRVLLRQSSAVAASTADNGPMTGSSEAAP